ncbi:hypothetical protein [Qipengyuania sediminis]|uniref:hypothetical protein n=1 Tax=Qipengyuania sediminis TaxID=1532023 RepID=UPI00198115E1|nr:hypothetical protein [Qipengyuania sediminis]
MLTLALRSLLVPRLAATIDPRRFEVVILDHPSQAALCVIADDTFKSGAGAIVAMFRSGESTEAEGFVVIRHDGRFSHVHRVDLCALEGSDRLIMVTSGGARQAFEVDASGVLVEIAAPTGRVLKAGLARGRDRLMTFMAETDHDPAEWTSAMTLLTQSQQPGAVRPAA